MAEQAWHPVRQDFWTPDDVYSVATYMRGDKRITVETEVRGDYVPVSKIRFIGHAVAIVEDVRGPDGQAARAEFPFDIDAKTLFEAFDKFTETCRVVGERVKADIRQRVRQQMLLTPGTPPPGFNRGGGRLSGLS
jgi:hypothetical protein